MADNEPTLRERAIATSPANPAALRDLVIDMATILDKLTEETEPPEENLN